MKLVLTAGRFIRGQNIHVAAFLPPTTTSSWNTPTVMSAYRSSSWSITMPTWTDATQASCPTNRDVYLMHDKHDKQQKARNLDERKYYVLSAYPLLLLIKHYVKVNRCNSSKLLGDQQRRISNAWQTGQSKAALAATLSTAQTAKIFSAYRSLLPIYLHVKVNGQAYL